MITRQGKDITNVRFGDLVAIKLVEPKVSACGNKYRQWLCRCDCGKEKIILQSNLMGGHTKSCGCKEHLRSHGMSRDRIYTTWHAMKARCTNPNLPVYKHYGGRGISYCKEWEKFELFYKWAKQSGYEENLTLERIDVNKGYEPSNCTWIPLSKQSLNKRNNVFVTANGETHTISEWSRITQISYTTLFNRVKRNCSEKEFLAEPQECKSHHKVLRDLK